MGPVQTQRLVRQYLDEGRHMEALVMAKIGLKRFPAFVVEFSRRQARAVLTTALTSHPNELRRCEALERLG